MEKAINSIKNRRVMVRTREACKPELRQYPFQEIERIIDDLLNNFNISMVWYLGNSEIQGNKDTGDL